VEVVGTTTLTAEEKKRPNGNRAGNITECVELGKENRD